MRKRCVCGVEIPSNRSLCRECVEIYGTNPNEWPEWLRWQVDDIQREWDYERNNDCLPLSIIESDGNGCYRAKRAFALRGCRTETHLYEDRHKHGG